jgi:hypothetical protein
MRDLEIFSPGSKSLVKHADASDHGEDSLPDVAIDVQAHIYNTAIDEQRICDVGQALLSIIDLSNGLRNSSRKFERRVTGCCGRRELGESIREVKCEDMVDLRLNIL